MCSSDTEFYSRIVKSLGKTSAMLDERSFPVDPQLLFYKLEMAVLDSLLDKPGMADEFDYFSMIGRGGGAQTSNESTSPPSMDQLHIQPPTSAQLEEGATSAVKGKEPLSRVRSHPKSKAKRTNSSQLELGDGGRPRTNSMPSSKSHQLRVRNFQISSKGLENRGDTVKTSSHCSLVSSTSSEGAGGATSHSDLDEAAFSSSTIDDTNSNIHRILLLGAEDVGKTALAQQFLTSDDVSTDDYLDDGKEKYCTVKVDGKESFLIIMDQDYDKNHYDPSLATAYIVVYSCTDMDSFAEAEGILKNVRFFEKDKAIMLCGNKSDLVRKRKISQEEGHQLALKYDAKFVETSTMLNHRVDHVLVGILMQIKEKAKLMRKSSKKSPNKASEFRKSVKGLVDRLVRPGSSSSKSKKSASPSP